MAIRVFQIRVYVGFDAAAAASHRVSEAGCGERRRAAAPSE